MYRIIQDTPQGEVTFEYRTLKQAAQGLVRIWNDTFKWFEILDKNDEPVPFERWIKAYKPQPITTCNTTTTLYMDYSINEVVDEKPKHKDYEVIYYNTKLYVYPWLDWWLEWDSYEDFEELVEVKERVCLVTKSGYMVLVYDSIQDYMESNAWHK